LVREALHGSAAGMAVISAIDGMGGVGKSALAIRAAHAMRYRFPDGQLFVDLEAHAPGRSPLTAHEALAWLLRSLGVPNGSIPPGLSERTAVFRDRLAGTRTLIVLDNAADTAQVRPLLPEAPGCLALITSRQYLAGLDDAYLLTLDVLDEAAATDLLHKTAGSNRITAQDPAVADLIRYSAGLPLAVRILGARLRHHPSLTVADLAEQLRSEPGRLDHLQDEDRNLTRVFDSSWDALTSAERQRLTLLGQVPGPDVDVYAAANLLGCDLRTAERRLDALLDHNLLLQRQAGRYRFHDLVGAYVRTRTSTTAATAEADHSASARLLDFYEATARRADRLIAHHSVTVDKTCPEPEVVPDLSDASEARAWIRAELDNLLAAVRATETPPARALALTQALGEFLQQFGPWSQAAELHSAALDTARDTGDARALAHAQWSLGRIRLANSQYQAAVEILDEAAESYRRLGQQVEEANARWNLGRALQFTNAPTDAANQYNQALTLYRLNGDINGEAHAQHELARLRYLDKDLPAAEVLEAQALAAYQQTANRLGQANALLGLGRIRQAQGAPEAAAELFEQVLAIHQSLGGRTLGEANALISIGRIRQATGKPAVAAELYEQALACYRAIGGRQGEANALYDLGRAQQDLGDKVAASDLFTQAKALFQELKDPHGTAQVLNSTGSLLAEIARPQGALACYRRALELARCSGSHDEEARAQNGISTVLAALSEAQRGHKPGDGLMVRHPA